MQVKPDGVQRALVGEIISRFERKGFILRGLKMFTPSKELAEEHYKDLSSKPFFGGPCQLHHLGPCCRHGACLHPALPCAIQV